MVHEQVAGRDWGRGGIWEIVKKRKVERRGYGERIGVGME